MHPKLSRDREGAVPQPPRPQNLSPLQRVIHARAIIVLIPMYLRWALVVSLLAPACYPATFGTVVPVIGGASDLVLDEARSRLYLVNTNQNRIEIYSIQQRRLLTPVKTDGTHLAVAM